MIMIITILLLLPPACETLMQIVKVRACSPLSSSGGLRLRLRRLLLLLLLLRRRRRIILNLRAAQLKKCSCAVCNAPTSLDLLQLLTKG
ncbi:hypothetical protein LOK49_LG04G03849 [Camellia lanceoleosa]|uniref:Uncharacterized protein n=1 Tax=Camellia lanceoleosa TaxID=1840588 RepID=A0ACC0HZC9_9ERIC|nr:hypothetical protein LOK49_LG04G03849 [Camellia lanceoleosa]